MKYITDEKRELGLCSQIWFLNLIPLLIFNWFNIVPADDDLYYMQYINSMKWCTLILETKLKTALVSIGLLIEYIHKKYPSIHTDVWEILKVLEEQ